MKNIENALNLYPQFNWIYGRYLELKTMMKNLGVLDLDVLKKSWMSEDVTDIDHELKLAYTDYWNNIVGNDPWEIFSSRDFEEKIQRFYDTSINFTIANWIYNTQNIHLLLKLLKSLKDNNISKDADIRDSSGGCGDVSIALLKNQFNNVFYDDVSNIFRLMFMERMKLHSLEYSKRDAPECFDVTVSFDTLEHVPNVLQYLHHLINHTRKLFIVTHSFSTENCTHLEYYRNIDMSKTIEKSFYNRGFILQYQDEEEYYKCFVRKE